MTKLQRLVNIDDKRRTTTQWLSPIRSLTSSSNWETGKALPYPGKNVYHRNLKGEKNPKLHLLHLVFEKSG